MTNSDEFVLHAGGLIMASDSELTLLLARAFDRAWDRYYRPGRVTIAPEIARPALAAHLVAMARDGTSEEGALAAGGLLHLISLTPDQPPDIGA